jgi:hypothetical protein
MTDLPEKDISETKTKRTGISLDAWAVSLALVLAILIRIGLIKQVPW